MKHGERHTIPIRTQADLWTFIECNVSLWDVLDPRRPNEPWSRVAPLRRGVR